MSDFKIACPGCGQHILANDDYAGLQISCPACQTAIVVPGNPAAPPAPLPVGRLSASALSSAQPHASVPVPSPEQQGSASYQAHVAHRSKRSYTGLIAALAAVVEYIPRSATDLTAAEPDTDD